ncbi:MAG: glycosyltransferase [Alphaproteobacteria bacterium]|nr:glycosyltransferase [Alphaproteobacteria bacterium]
MPKISIIIPNYNTEKYLDRCLTSLIQQTFSDIEIILIDDGSTDNSVKIMKKYAEKDARIKIIEQSNSGPAKARNRGLETATGKYLMFCDSDDWYELDMCEIMHNTIEKKGVDSVCCHTFLDCEENLDIEQKKSRLTEKYYNFKKSGKHILKDKWILYTNVLLWNKIWRRDLIERYHIRFPEGHEHDDDAFWYMYSIVAKSIFFLKKPLYHYFLRVGSIMSSQVEKKPKNKMDRIAVSEYVLNFLVRNKLQHKKAYLMAQFFRRQLKGVRKFFTPQEISDLCEEINEKIQSQLSTHYKIVYSKTNNQLTLKRKGYLQLLYKKIM